MAAQRLAHAEALNLIRRGRFTDAYAPLILAGRLAQAGGRPDLALTCWFNLACAASCADDPTRALEFVDRGLATARASGLSSREIPLLTARAHVLLRLDRAPEAVAACEDGRRLAERLDDAGLRAVNEHDPTRRQRRRSSPSAVTNSKVARPSGLLKDQVISRTPPADRTALTRSEAGQGVRGSAA